MRPEESCWAVKAYMPSSAKEKWGGGEDVVVWYFKDQEGNSHEDRKAKVW